MRRTLTTTTAALLLAGLAACSGSPKPAADAQAGPASQPLTASTALQQITAAVPSAKLSGTVTAANDPNHLLGRPNQYTSKTTFADSRIKAADVSGTKPGDVERGGAIEVFGSPDDAETRAKYIQAVTKSLPALAEYDYVHGAVLVRVSHYLTPAQAAGYKSAADGLG
jgi:hypothetical protein